VAVGFAASVSRFLVLAGGGVVLGTLLTCCHGRMATAVVAGW
jgi:hypothetical protein